MQVNCLILDDEQPARELLTAYAGRLDGLNVLAACRSPLEADRWLSRHPIDLLFLDIQMPNRSGIDYLRTLHRPPKIILTTAFSQYALEGFELEAVDYLLKPIGFERFAKAVERVRQLLKNEQSATAFHQQQNFDRQFIMVKVGYDHRKLFLKDIQYVKAMREYVRYHTDTEKIMELKALTEVEKELPASHFMRVHRSFIIAKAAVFGHLQNKLLLKDSRTLPIGKTYKAQVLKQLFEEPF